MFLKTTWGKCFNIMVNLKTDYKIANIVYDKNIYQVYTHIYMFGKSDQKKKMSK